MTMSAHQYMKNVIINMHTKCMRGTHCNPLLGHVIYKMYRINIKHKMAKQELYWCPSFRGRTLSKVLIQLEE